LHVALRQDHEKKNKKKKKKKRQKKSSLFALLHAFLSPFLFHSLIDRQWRLAKNFKYPKSGSTQEPCLQFQQCGERGNSCKAPALRRTGGARLYMPSYGKEPPEAFLRQRATRNIATMNHDAESSVPLRELAIRVKILDLVAEDAGGLIVQPRRQVIVECSRVAGWAVLCAQPHEQ